VRGLARKATAEGIEFSADGLALLPPYVSLGGLRRWNSVLLAATGALAAVSLGVELSHLRLLFQPAEGEAAKWLARTAQSATGGTLLALRVAIFTATTALFLIWVYTARANVRALGVRRPRFSRGDSVGAFLIPGVNVVRPRAVVAEIWQASDPTILDPFGWRAAPVPRVLRVWWSVVVLSAAFAGMALFTGATSGMVLGRLRLAVGMSALADLSACAAVALTWLVVVRLSETQQAKWERIRGRAPAAAAG
jgi:hypothetical protein